MKVTKTMFCLLLTMIFSHASAFDIGFVGREGQYYYIDMDTNNELVVFSKCIPSSNDIKIQKCKSKKDITVKKYEFKAIIVDAYIKTTSSKELKRKFTAYNNLDSKKLKVQIDIINDRIKQLEKLDHDLVNEFTKITKEEDAAQNNLNKLVILQNKYGSVDQELLKEAISARDEARNSFNKNMKMIEKVRKMEKAEKNKLPNLLFKRERTIKENNEIDEIILQYLAHIKSNNTIVLNVNDHLQNPQNQSETEAYLVTENIINDLFASNYKDKSCPLSMHDNALFSSDAMSKDVVCYYRGGIPIKDAKTCRALGGLPTGVSSKENKIMQRNLEPLKMSCDFTTNLKYGYRVLFIVPIANVSDETGPRTPGNAQNNIFFSEGSRILSSEY